MNYSLQLDTIRTGFDGITCWVQCRAGAIPGDAASGRLPIVVLTMQKLLLRGSDIFFELTEMRTDDLGRTWSDPVAHVETLGRRHEANGIQAQICDATPTWHATSGRLLNIGHVARYEGDHLMKDPRPRDVAYTVYDAGARTWSRWDTLALPETADGRYFSCGAGSAQWVELPDGDILLPVYLMPRKDSEDSWGHCYRSGILRCGFDGQRLTFKEAGPLLSVLEPRGLGEPSLTCFQGRYFMTIRNDVRGYVSRSADGMSFEPVRPWTFDDGTEIGNYNTQQHWVTHHDALFLVYTRRGLNNDHVFRHRAPLVMAQVDPDRLCLIRSTERVIIPERGARLGNFAVAQVSPDESWVTVSEWMQTNGPNPHDHTVCQRYGADNAIFAGRIRWETPNRLVPG